MYPLHIGLVEFILTKKNFFANFAVEPKNFLELYPEYILPPDQKDAFLRDRKSVIAGQKLASKYHWEIGDTLTLKGTIFPGNWEFVVRGIYRGRDKSTDETQFFFHWDYLNESLKKTTSLRADQAGFYLVGVNNPDLADDVAVTIDKTFKNSLAETLTETEKAFQLSFVSMSEAIVIAIQLVSFVVIIIIMQSWRIPCDDCPRANWRICNIEDPGIRRLVYCCAHIWRIPVYYRGCCAIGIAFTFPIAKVFGNVMGTYFPVFNVTTKTIYLDIAVSLLVGMVAAIIPTWRAITIRIADGLRRIG